MRVRKSRKCLAVIGTLVILIGVSGVVRAQGAGSRVLRPEDPTQFLETSDAKTLRQTLGTVLDRMSQANAGSVIALYWNTRRFRKGRRRGKCPYQLLGLNLPSYEFWRILQRELAHESTLVAPQPMCRASPC